MKPRPDLPTTPKRAACSEPGCTTNAEQRGLCMKHYMKFYRTKIRTGEVEKITQNSKKRVTLFLRPELADWIQADEANRRAAEAAINRAEIESRIL